MRETPTQDVANETPYKGLKIYEQPAPDDAASEEDATPPPTQTKPAPPTPAQTEMTAPAQTKTAAAAETVKPAQLQPMKPAPLKPSLTETRPPPVVEKPAPTVSKPPETETPAATPPAPAPAVKTASAGTGAFVLQIGAYKSQADATAAWRSYQAKHPVVAGSASDVMKVDLGAKGTWYRLRIGSFDSKAAAAAMCQKLKADGGDCLTAKR